jgi:hypothetical protein
MTTYTVTHKIETDVDSFWNAFLDPQLVRALMDDLKEYAGYEVVEERRDESGNFHRRLQCWTKLEIPAIAQKFVGDGKYAEVGVFDNAKKRYKAQYLPNQNSDKIRTDFEIYARPIGDGTHCERVIEVDNTVKIFGIGGMLASLLERTQREVHQHSADFTNHWLRVRTPGK